MIETDAIQLALMRRRRKNPKLARALSLCLPGLGQLYNGQPLKALLYVTSLFLLVPWPFAVIDAYETAHRLNQASAARALGIDPHNLPQIEAAYAISHGTVRSLRSYNILAEAEAIAARVA